MPRFKMLTIGLALLLGLATQPQARAALTIPMSDTALDASELRIGFAGQYFRSEANYDYNSSRSSLPASTYFQSLQGGLFAQYGLVEDVTLFGALPFMSNTAAALLANKATATNSTSGMGEATLGLRYQPFRDPVHLVIEAGGDIPLYSRLAGDDWSSFTASGPVALGTGTTSFTLLTRIELPLNPELFVGASGGLVARSGGFSDLMSYSLYLKYEEPRTIFAKVGLVGAFSATDDQNVSFLGSDLPKERSTAAIAGSLAYNAINPSYTAAQAVFGVYVAKTVFITGGIDYPFRGKDYPASPTYMAALGIDLGGERKESSYAHSNRGFQEYYLPSKIVKVNNSLRQVLVDKGKGDGIHVGELLDIFEPDKEDGTFGETVARGRVLEVGPTRSKIQVLEYFKEIPMQEGFVVRRPVH